MFILSSVAQSLFVPFLILAVLLYLLRLRGGIGCNGILLAGIGGGGTFFLERMDPALL
jgi:hypothetical protein